MTIGRDAVVRAAVRELDHDQIVRLGRRDKNISSYGSMMFSNEAAYEKGWIRVATTGVDGDIVGFTCVRHKSRSPETMLYFIMVDPDHAGNGVGQLLMADLEQQTPHPRIALKVMKDNHRAIRFYKRLGYRIESEDEYKGKGLLMAKEVSRDG